MKSLVINLSSEPARWLATRARFEAAGLPVTRLEAVSAQAVDSSARGPVGYSEELNRRAYFRPLSAGEIGCYASHQAAWRLLLESADRCLAVFEDDIEPLPDLPRVLEALGRAPPGCDLVKLIGRPAEDPAAQRPLGAGHALIEYRRVPSRTAGYVVSRRGAEKLLAHRRRFGRPVDVDLRHWWECDLAIGGVLPYPVRLAEASEHSTIDGRGVRPTPSMRLRKLLLQGAYTSHNWLAQRQREQARAGAAGSRDGFAAPRSEPRAPR